MKDGKWTRCPFSVVDSFNEHLYGTRNLIMHRFHKFHPIPLYQTLSSSILQTYFSKSLTNWQTQVIFLNNQHVSIVLATSSSIKWTFISNAQNSAHLHVFFFSVIFFFFRVHQDRTIMLQHVYFWLIPPFCAGLSINQALVFSSTAI